MSRIVLAVLAGLFCIPSGVRADDVAEARKAFDLFVLYSKTADAHLLEMFAPDVSVTLAYDGGDVPLEKVIPTETFRDIVKESIAAKDGSNDTYQDVKCVQEGDTVKLTCTRVESGTGKPEPFLLIYAKDAAGRFTIKAMKMTVPEPKVSSTG